MYAELTRIHSQTPSLDPARTADGSGASGLLGLGKSDGLYGWEVSVKGLALHDVCRVAVKRALKRPIIKFVL